jgi:hypothetical protein
MGWNSWDCLGGTVTEVEALATGEYMQRHLQPYGWQYVVLDAEWYFDSVTYGAASESVTEGKTGLNIDDYGRLLPSKVKFPSAAGGGFRELADRLHAMGCRLGVHLMRGIPRRAVELNLPVLGTQVRARDIVDTTSTCQWCDLCYGVDMAKPGAQAYYDSVLALCAEWGVDFIKYDDIAGPYYAKEIEAVALAIQRCGRPIVLSLSPGNDSNVENLAHARQHAEMFRITGDIWDKWWCVNHVAGILPDWAAKSRPGAWADADMLPLGRIGIRTHGCHGPAHMTHLTRDEQVTVMTLWCIACSPLIMGGYLPDNDEWTLSLLTNGDAIRVNQEGRAPREIVRAGSCVVWESTLPDGQRAVAFINLGDAEQTISVALTSLGCDGAVSVRDAWARVDAGVVDVRLSATLPAHGSRLYVLKGV